MPKKDRKLINKLCDLLNSLKNAGCWCPKDRDIKLHDHTSICREIQKTINERESQ